MSQQTLEEEAAVVAEGLLKLVRGRGWLKTFIKSSFVVCSKNYGNNPLVVKVKN